MNQSINPPQTLDPKIDPPPASSPETKDCDVEDPKQEEEEEEEKAECGFCLYMKGGGCKDEFVAWEKCVEDAERDKEDIAEKCFGITSKLKQCMEAHADYYEPILSAEKAMTDSITEELENEKAHEAAAAADSKSEEKVEVATVSESES